MPTQAQWEYAARSRGQQNRPYTWSDNTPLVANSGRANIDSLTQIPTRTTKVRNSQDDQTAQGIFDLVGNVREWCRDAGPTATEGILKGGSWNSVAKEYSNYAREFLGETEEVPDVGFRIVVEWPTAQTAGRTP